MARRTSSKRNRHTQQRTKATQRTPTLQPSLDQTNAWKTTTGIDGFIAKNWKPFLALCALIALTLCLLRFDPKVSIGGDDSFYYVAAYDFYHGIQFPGWHGPLYPILIAPLVGGLALPIPAIKVASVIATILALIIIGLAFRKRVHPIAWAAALAITALCPTIITLASTTYSEPLFMLLQALLFLLLFKTITDYQNRPRWVNPGLAYPILLGLTITALALTRNIGLGAIIAIPLFHFLYQRSYRSALVTLATFTLAYALFSLYRNVGWGVQGHAFADQWATMTQVDFYDPSQGHEDLKGLIARFWTNCENYLSAHFLQAIGFDTKASTTATIVIVALAAVVFILGMRKQGAVLLLGLYLATLIGATFITQQVAWNQVRLIIIYLPLLILFFLQGLLTLQSVPIQKGVALAAILLTVTSITLNATDNIRSIEPKTLQANLRGDMYARLTTDWYNYLKVSEFAGKNLPEEATIACRKPYNSRVYAKGRPFLGIFKTINGNADSIANQIDSLGIDYIIVAHLRMNPSKKTDQFINTIHRTLLPILFEKPDYLSLIHAQGSDEQAYLFRIEHNLRTPIDLTDKDYEKRIRAGLLVYPDNPMAYLRLNELHLSQNNPKAVIENINRVSEIYSRFNQALPREFAQHNLHALILLQDYQTAQILVEQLFPTLDHTDTYTEIDLPLLKLAQELYNQLGQPQRALRYARIAQRIEQNDTETASAQPKRKG